MKLTILKMVEGLILNKSHKTLRQAMVTFSAFLVFCAIAPNSNALPVIHLLKDELVANTKVSFEGLPELTRMDSYKGRALGLQSGHIVNTWVEYYSNEPLAAEICSAAVYFERTEGTNWRQFLVDVKADNTVAKEPYYADARSEALLKWRFYADEDGALLRLSATIWEKEWMDILLFDETSSKAIANYGHEEVGWASGPIDLVNSHIYSLTAHSWVETPTDPFAEFYVVFENIDGIIPVPEPATMLLLASGLIGLAGYGRKKLFKK